MRGITQKQITDLITGRLSGRVAAGLLGVSEVTVRRARHDAVKQGLGQNKDGFDGEKMTQAVEVLRGALDLKANAGGAIKTQIREALDLLEKC